MATKIGSLEYHNMCLGYLCRIWANWAQTKQQKSSKPQKLCENYAEKIYIF